MNWKNISLIYHDWRSRWVLYFLHSVSKRNENRAQIFSSTVERNEITRVEFHDKKEILQHPNDWFQIDWITKPKQNKLNIPFVYSDVLRRDNYHYFIPPSSNSYYNIFSNNVFSLVNNSLQLSDREKNS